MDVFKYKYAISGALAGILAIVISAVCLFEGPFYEPPKPQPITESIAEKAKNLVSSLKGEPLPVVQEKRKFNIDTFLAVSIYVLGGIAICFGVISFIAKEESLRATASAVGLGLFALVFKAFAMYAIPVLVVFIIILYFFEYLDC